MSARRIPRWVLLLLLIVVLPGGGLLVWRSRSHADPPVSRAKQIPIPEPAVGDMEPAVQEIVAQSRKNLLANPGLAESWGWYGAVLDAHHFYEEAEPCYRRALELAPKDPRYSYNLAVLLESRGVDPEESLALYRKVAELQPKYPPVHVRIGYNLTRKGDSQGALAAFQQALAFDPRLWVARRSLGRVWLDLEQFAKAAAELEQVAAAVANDGPTHAALAQAYAGLGQAERAAAASERARGLDDVLPLSDPLHYIVLQQGRSARLASERAASRMADGDYAGAIEDLKLVLRTRADDPKIHERLAEAYRRAGQDVQAQRELEEARRRSAGPK